MSINDASFWVLVGFLTLFLLVGKNLWRLISGALDDRSREIAEKIKDASRMREEAMALLNTCKRQHIEASEHASGILAHAEEEAKRLREKALKDAARFLEIEERLFQERLRQAEERALEEIREKAILVAGDAVREILKAQSAQQLSHEDQERQFQELCARIATSDIGSQAA